MAEGTKISWTDHTFNPWQGCQKASPGCANCYAEPLAARYSKLKLWGPGSVRKPQSSRYWGEPRRWDTRAKRAGRKELVFCGSMCDVFDDHLAACIERQKLWPLIRETPNLIWQLLTKRPENILRMLPDDWGAGWPNVWLGVSVESDKYAGRISMLKTLRARLRFVSYEPAIGYLNPEWLDGIDWVIVGGESGPHFRRMEHGWARLIHEYCARENIPFFYKQSAGKTQGHNPYLDGELIQEFPAQAARPGAKGE